MVATRHYTATEFAGLDSEFRRFELIKGELREVAAAGARHGAIGIGLGAELRAAAKREKSGSVFGADTGFLVMRDPDSVLMPDVSFVRAERLPDGEMWEGFVPFPPDLAIEIESPSDRLGQMHEKIALYFDGGTLLVWLIRPRHQTVTVFRPGEPELVLSKEHVLDGGGIVPGFSLSLAELFSPGF